MSAVVRKNERSWAIELISKINAICSANGLVIKRAGGESTVAAERGARLFPDVILYGDAEQNVILQGWEIKMPDVPIEDAAFIENAQSKAVALGLNTFLLWNFTYAVLYAKGEEGDFAKLRQWDATSHIRTRADVETYRACWERLLEDVIIEVNAGFASGAFCKASLGAAISENTIAALVARNKDAVASCLKEAAFRDSVMSACIDNWWRGIKAEYEKDEVDKYKAYAKNIILNWANRIIFAHIIKKRQNAALLINDLGSGTSPAKANSLFGQITAQCDFYNVFAGLKYSDILPGTAWDDFVELSAFLKDSGVDHLKQEALQDMLESSVAAGKRAINGQFTTPAQLARLLARLTVKDWTEPVLDCCCGTGTIAKALIQIKRMRLSPKDAVESVWACDKNSYPLQLANISMSGAETVRVANRLFRHNALTLSVGEDVPIVNPDTGEEMRLSLPEFGAVVSNLPFVPFELIPDDDKAEIAKLEFESELDGRSDLYCYIAVKICDAIKPGGALGIIASNSWLGTKAGVKFVAALRQRYRIRQVHISGRGRWFKNADVVATIMVLEKGASDESAETDFWLWQKPLEDIAEGSDAENALVNSALLGQELDGEVARLSRYSQRQIGEILECNVCYNALFHSVEWLPNIKEKIIPINEAFEVFRGSRRGWDALFYPKEGSHKIEPVYLKKVLLNARSVTRLVASADGDAFCCGAPLSELERRGHTGALEWVLRFADQRNGTGKPLPEVLKKKGMQWYELQDSERAEFFTMMNPDQRLFFARFESPSFINQRLIGLTHMPSFPDAELNHALLNSMFTLFCIEAAGFGRGLGVLDINKNSIANCCMLNPNLVSAAGRKSILAAFEKVKSRQILKTSDELLDADRLRFEHEVLRAFRLEECFERIKASLLSMQKARAEAKVYP